MPRIHSTLPRDYLFFAKLSSEERQFRLESWKSFERCIEDGSYHQSTMRALKDDKRKRGVTDINKNEPERMVLPSFEKRLPPPPRTRVPTAYERRSKAIQIDSGLFIEIVPRSPTDLDVFCLNARNERIQIPKHVELINCADLRPVTSYAIRPDMPCSMWTIEKSERYALVNLDDGKIMRHFKFRWEVREISALGAH
ncbi:hypothetical protein PENSPDRAFT_749241 [Peniophora sp. CONT]|nr:hypothetical protein PENSPDRAFT_749241 [Peniophora sp. CONT]